MMSATTTERSYDEVPYDSQAFHESHPDLLATLAILHGMTPPPIASASVLELGCAVGGNLIPMALAAPNARFVGIDLSQRQIEEGKRLVAQLGLTNIDLRAASITDVGAELGSFDYVICHGVYSWVSADVRVRILDLCAERLSPQGVAFISYNVLPGWVGLGLAREMMLYHGGPFAEPHQRIKEVRSFLEELARALPDSNSPYGQLLLRELSEIAGKTDAYLAHEYLEEVNQPFEFHEFIVEARSHGLSYLSDARFRTGPDSQPSSVRGFLERFAGPDVVRREQYTDYLRNRRFRRSLLVHEGTPLRPPKPLDLEHVRAMAVAVPTTPQPDAFGPSVVEFATPDGVHRLQTTNPLLKTAILALCERYPSSVPVPELRVRAHSVLQGHPTRIAFDRSPSAFDALLFQAFSLGILDLSTWEPPFVTDISLQPTASSYARLLAQNGRRVTNLRHRVSEVSEFDRLVLRQLDGTRSRGEIIDELITAVFDGTFPLHRDGQPITDAIEVRQVLERSLEPALVRLRMLALLTG